MSAGRAEEQGPMHFTSSKCPYSAGFGYRKREPGLYLTVFFQYCRDWICGSMQLQGIVLDYTKSFGTRSTFPSQAFSIRT